MRCHSVILASTVMLVAWTSAGIESGLTLGGDVPSPGASNVYPFAAVTGDTVQIRMAGVAGDFASAPELYSPEGQLLGSALSYGIAEFTCGLTNSGTFSIVCKGGTVLDTGPYHLTMLRLTGYALASGDPEIGAISNGLTVTAHIDQPTDLDAATFTAAAGDTVQIRMAAASGAFASALELRDPAGNLLSSSTVYGVSEITRTLTSNGLYTVICKPSGTETGTYYATMLKLTGYALASGDPDVGAISNGLTAQGSVGLPTDLDAATFSAVTGDTIQIRMAAANGGFASVVELRDPGGTLLGSASGFGVAELTRTTPTNGTHTIICKSFEADTGTYNVTMLRLTGYALASGDPDVGVLSNGLTAGGRINGPTDLDAATFTAAAGDTVQIRMAGVSSTFPSAVELRGPDGQLLGSASGYGIAEISRTLTNSGPFTVVCKPSGIQTGAYHITMLQMTGYPLTSGDPDIGASPPGVTNYGVVHAATDLDALLFAARAGDTAQIRMAATSGGFASAPELRSPAGQLLGSALSYGVAEFSRTLDTAGKYSVICKPSGTNMGTYYVTCTLSGTNTVSDIDHDGVANWDEINAWTDPFDASSFFAVTNITPFSTNGAILRWQTVGGNQYRVQYSDALGSGVFADIVRSTAVETESNVSAGVRDFQVFTNTFAMPPGPPTNNARYYRVRIVR